MSSCDAIVPIGDLTFSMRENGDREGIFSCEASFRVCVNRIESTDLVIRCNPTWDRDQVISNFLEETISYLNDPFWWKDCDSRWVPALPKQHFSTHGNNLYLNIVQHAA